MRIVALSARSDRRLFNVTEQLIRKAEQAGTTTIMLTVDRQGGRNTDSTVNDDLHYEG